MKRRIKKLVSFITLTSFIIGCFVSPALADDMQAGSNEPFLYGDYCDYTLEELTALLPSSLNEESTTGSMYDFIEKGRDKANFLQQFDMNKEYISQLSLLDIDNICDIIQGENLSQEQAETLIKTWAENESYGVDAESPIDIEPKIEDEVAPASYSGGIVAVGNSSDNTGYHYIVKSMPGYNKASGYFSLPTTTVGSNMPADKPDVPYGHFGLYTTDNNVGLDL